MHEHKQENKIKLIGVIRTQTHKEISAVVDHIVKWYLSKRDIIGLYALFSEIHEELYHDLLSKKIKMEKKTSRLLEFLATPIYEKPIKEQRHIFEKYCKD